jgi:hypothetical protein
MKYKALVVGAAGTALFGAAAITTMATASASPAAAPHYKVVQKTFTVQSGTSKLKTVTCPSGMKPVGGGGGHYGENEFPAANPADAGIDESDISKNGRGWTVSAYEATGFGPASFTADVVCARL